MRLFRQVTKMLSGVTPKNPSATPSSYENQTLLTRYSALSKKGTEANPSYYDFEKVRDDLVRLEQSGKQLKN